MLSIKHDGEYFIHYKFIAGQTYTIVISVQNGLIPSCSLNYNNIKNNKVMISREIEE